MLDTRYPGVANDFCVSGGKLVSMVENGKLKVCPVCKGEVPPERGPAAFYCSVSCRDKARDKRVRLREKGDNSMPRAPSGGDGTPAADQDMFTYRLGDAASLVTAVRKTLDRMDMRHDPINDTRVAIVKSLAAAIDDAMTIGAIANCGAAIASNVKQLRETLLEMAPTDIQVDPYDKLIEELEDGPPSRPDPTW